MPTMDSFDRFLKDTDTEEGRDIVGLALYYLHTYGEEDGVAVQDIRVRFDISNISMAEVAIAAHLAEMDQEGLVTKSLEDHIGSLYYLTRSGFRIFGRLAGEWGRYGVRDGRFLETDQIQGDDDFELLVTNINRSYRNEINDGTLVLTRKLYENLIVEILRMELGGEEIDIYYNTSTGRHHGLGTLCGNLRGKISELGHYSRQLNDELVDSIEDFKQPADSQTHAVRIGMTDEELEEMSEEATDIAEALWRLREEVRRAND